MRCLPTGLLVAAYAVLVLTACSRGDQTGTPLAEILPSAAFGDLFTRVDSIVLEQPYDFPLVTISGLDVGPDGGLVVADVGEARVSIFSPAGMLQTPIGRRGDGPSEFRLPRAPLFDAQGLVHVVDPLQYRISVFSMGGELVREISTPAGFLVQDMELAPDGYLLTGQPPMTSGDGVVMALDTAGGILWQQLVIGSLYPSGQRDTPRWQTLRSQAVTLVGDTVLVSHTLFDSLWMIGLDDGDPIGSRALSVHGYRPPWMPSEDPRGASEIRDWAQQQMRATTIESDGHIIVVPFAVGAYWQDAARSLAALRDPAGSWLTMRDTPVVLRVKNGRLYTLERPSLEEVVVGVFEWRGR